VERDTVAVILNWNNADMTIMLLKNIMGVGENCDVIVVDNNSCVEERERLQEFFSREGNSFYSESQIDQILERQDKLLLLLNDNYGYAKGNNFGLRLASRLKYEYAVISNNDIEIVSPLIDDLKRILESHQDIAVVGPMISAPGRNDGPFDKLGMRLMFWRPAFYPFHWLTFHISRLLRLNRPGSKEIEKEELTFPYCISGSFMMARMSSLEKVDYFDENTFLYCEEMILAEKLLEKDLRMAYLPGKEVKHQHGASTARLDADISKLEFKSRLYYFGRYRGFGKVRIAMLKVASWVYKRIWFPLFQTSKRTLRGVRE